VCKPIVILQKLPQSVVSERIHCMPPYTGHCLGGDHGVDDRFFSGLHRCKESGVDLIVGQHAKWANTSGRSCRWIRGGKRNEDVT
jgi:hypothetical protein